MHTANVIGITESIAFKLMSGRPLKVNRKYLYVYVTNCWLIRLDLIVN